MPNNLPPEVQELISKIIVILVGSGAMAGMGRWLLSKVVDKLERIPEKEWFDRVNSKLDAIPSQEWVELASNQLANIPSKATIDAVLASFVANSSSIAALETKASAADSRITDAHRRLNQQRGETRELGVKIDELTNRVTTIEKKQNPMVYNVIEMPKPSDKDGT